MFLSGLTIGFLGTLQEGGRATDTGSETSEPEARIGELSNPECCIGIVYPMSGRLEWWSADAQPIIEAAKRDIQEMLKEAGYPIRLRFLFEDSKSTEKGAFMAVKNLISQGAQVIVGLPTSGEVEAVFSYVNYEGVPVISPSSTSSRLSKPDNTFRLSTPENYRARLGAELAIELGFTRVVVVHRFDEWGISYAGAVSEVFNEGGLEAYRVSFEPSHTFYMNYSEEVLDVEKLVAGREGETLVYLVAWENEDYSILSEARRSPVLSNVRWFTSALYPSILENVTMFGKAEGLRDFAMEIGLWAPEQRPMVNDLTISLLEEARSVLGRYPSYEHIYAYDAMMIAANALLSAGGGGRGELAKIIPLEAERYFGATGLKTLDSNGDLMAEDTAFIGVMKTGDAYEFGYYAFHDSVRDEFTVLNAPQRRTWFFSPQA